MNTMQLHRNNAKPKHVWLFVASLLLLTGLSLGSAIVSANQAQPPLPTITLQINNQALDTELATTSEQRYMGLSFRKILNNNAGMLFVYSREQMLVFTMRNTLLPLSIAYISQDMTINEIHHMNVGPDQLFPAKQAARYALEVNQGWFAANGIKAGDKITLPK